MRSSPFPSAEARQVPVRRQLAQDTCAAHQALHAHPVFGALDAPGVRMVHYRAFLAAMAAVHRLVERQRQIRGLFPELALTEASCALDTDVAASGAQAALALVPALPPTQGGAADLLGALYVLHGSRYGHGQLHRNVLARLPGAPQAFLALRPSRATWSQLCDALEVAGRSPAGRQALSTAAARAFHKVETVADRIAAGLYLPGQQGRLAA